MTGGDRRLHEAVTGDLRLLADAVRAMSVSALADESIPFKVASLAFWPDQTGDGLAPDVVSVGSLRDREVALEAPSGHERFRLAWTPEEMAVPGVDLGDFSSISGFSEAEARLMETLDGEVEDPSLWALSHALADLSLRPPLAVESEHFIAYAFDDQFGDDLVDSLRASCPSSLVASLRRQGLLPDSIEEIMDA